MKKDLLSFSPILILLFQVSLISCAPESSRGYSNNGALDEKNLKSNEAYVMELNPSVQSNNDNFVLPITRKNYIAVDPVEITSKDSLLHDCEFTELGVPYQLDSCFQIQAEENSEVTKKERASWYFPAQDDKFLEVQSYYHAKKSTQMYLEGMEFISGYLAQRSIQGTLPLFSASPFNKGISDNFWYTDILGINRSLKIVLNCDGDHSAYYSAAAKRLCLGGNQCSDEAGCVPQNFSYAEDPSVIYHEMGHAFVDIMINTRNQYSSIKTNLKTALGYDEADAINEGIADFFSFAVNGRKHMGEWAIGSAYTANSLLAQSRAMSEDDPIYNGLVTKDSQSRLRYPDYLMFDPNQPLLREEDIHYAGQIASHYLTSLAEELQLTCSIDHKTSSQYILLLLAETLAEVGDLSGTFSNLDSINAYEWNQVANPPSYRRFFQVFAKNILHHISSNLCLNFTKDDSEALLDSYGLLLFRTYNDDGDQVLSSCDGISLNCVNESNRQLSSLVSKELINFSADSSDYRAVIVDDPTSIQNYLAHLTFKGANVQISTGLAGTEYNYANASISKGEIFGLGLNLYNHSNVPMGGIQILANDWVHMKLDPVTGTKKPIQIDGFPSIAEGGIVDNTGLSSYSANDASPICFVLENGSSSTQWVSQDSYRENYNISDSNCLNNANISGNDFDPNECLLRVLPGASQGHYSKIDSTENWLGTIKLDEGEEYQTNASAIMLFEVNKKTPPGTIFNCRFRVRHSNCSDCYSESSSGSDDYSEFEYGGQKPFQILNLQLQVN